MDPWCSNEESTREYGIQLTENPINNNYDAVIITVAHDKFKELGYENIQKLGKENFVLYDLKYVLPREVVDMRL